MTTKLERAAARAMAAIEVWAAAKDETERTLAAVSAASDEAQRAWDAEAKAEAAHAAAKAEAGNAQTAFYNAQADAQRAWDDEAWAAKALDDAMVEYLEELAK